MTDTLFAYDGSGSTEGSKEYHHTARVIRSTLPTTTTILRWATNAEVITHQKLAEINAACTGNGGTESECVADWIHKHEFHGHLIILTDGQVNARSIDACAAVLGPTWHFASVTAHLVHTGGEVNMSVTCPFTRVSPHTIYTYRPDTDYAQTTAVTLTTDDMATVDKIRNVATLDAFMTMAPVLEKAVTARTMGTMGDPAIRDALLDMKKRLIASKGATAGGPASALTSAVTAGDITAAIQAGAELAHDYYAEDETAEGDSWSARLNRMISMCEGALRSTFDLSNLGAAIKSDRARRATTVAPVTVTGVATTVVDADINPGFVCPITCDAEHDVVLLVADDMPPLLAGLDKDTVNMLADCPLNLMRRPDLMDALKSRLDHPVSLQAIKSAYDVGAPITESPMTRRPVTGGLCLGAAVDHREATDWTLAHAIAGDKCMGNANLWFACVWLLVENGHVPYLEPVLPALRSHMLWRLQTQKTAISLTGLAEFPSTRVPLGVAIWYIFVSPLWTPDPHRDLVRAHLLCLDSLKQLLDLVGYTIPAAIVPYIKRTRVLMSMLAWIKRDRTTLPAAMRALYQRSIHLTYEEKERWIPVDGPADAEQIAAVMATLPSHYSQCSPAELVGLAALVDPSKSAAVVPLPVDWVPPTLPVHTVIWQYGLRVLTHVLVPICPATCRPYYRVRDVTWKEAATAAYGVPQGQMLSLNEAFGNYVYRCKAYPSREDLLMYLGRRGQLPFQTEVFVAEVMQDYAPIMASVSANEFARRFDASREINVRIALET